MNSFLLPPMDELQLIESPDALRQFVTEHPEVQKTETIHKLHAEIVSGIVVDPGRAQRLAHLARWMAEYLKDDYAHGVADRCEGHVRYAASEYAAALQSYESAARRFEDLGREADLAVTLTAAIQSLIYLGRYDTAIQFSERARVIFQKQSDALRLARLDSNVGNILYRQDRYAEAHIVYRNAYDRLTALDRPRDAAAVLSNMAVASTGMGEFAMAAAEYGESRKIAENEGMAALAAELDYNVAYLHFLRGDYTHAITLYNEARQHSETAGEAYRAALCDLDLGEVYLDLNLLDESRFLCRRAAAKFQRLGMDYERAKAVAFLAIGEHRSANVTLALVLFRAARCLFLRSRNHVWTAIIDLYRAILLRDLGWTERAMKIAIRARHVFQSEALPNRMSLSDLFLAGLYLEQGNHQTALETVNEATCELTRADYPMVFFHAEYLKGRIHTEQGNLRGAYAALLRAAELLETVRSRLAGDELKVAFVQNKLDVYAKLMLLARQVIPAEHSGAVMFEFIEKSKSRSLADRMASISQVSHDDFPAAPEFLKIRQELNALYRELENREAERRDSCAVRKRIAAHEERLKHLATEESVRSAALNGAADWIPVSLEALSSALPPNSRLIEFFIAENRVWAGVIGSEEIHFKDLGALDPIKSALAFFNFQVSKTFRHTGRGGPAPRRRSATLAHLNALYASLIQPLESSIGGAADLIIVPHGVLHGLPFHALYDGSAFLIDRATISYAPSASVFRLCQQRMSRAVQRSLIMGLPSEENPCIAQEIDHIAHLLPEPAIFLGPEATEAVLFEHAGKCRYIHIATHGQFRRDNPAFSSIRLADAQINVLDLYRLAMDAELVTLSGCSTGAGMVVSGDEMVGLARGLMHAGTRSVLLTLWDVHDLSTARFMTSFYQNLFRGQHAAGALRNAVLLLKGDWPEPYYWAPFTVSGYALAP